MLGRVLCRAIAFGAFTVVGTKFNINPKTVAKLWHSTLKMVHGYLSNSPMNTEYIIDNVPPQAFETKFANAGQKPVFEHETVLQEIKNIDPNARRSMRYLAHAIGI
jgi:hypothetical protein